MFQDSNFLSDPNPENNTARFCTIISTNESKEDLENSMNEFNQFCFKNKKNKIPTRAFVFYTGHGIISTGIVGTQIVHTTVDEYTNIEEDS